MEQERLVKEFVMGWTVGRKPIYGENFAVVDGLELFYKDLLVARKDGPRPHHKVVFNSTWGVETADGLETRLRNRLIATCKVNKVSTCSARLEPKSNIGSRV